MINAGAQRYDRARPTENFFGKHYEPSGELVVPMVSLHNRWDPVVPLFNEDIYGAKVETAGNSINLEQQIFDRYGHTNFSATEAADALMLLRTKVLGVAY